jgi:hypothetical protein
MAYETPITIKKAIENMRKSLSELLNVTIKTSLGT